MEENKRVLSNKEVVEQPLHEVAEDVVLEDRQALVSILKVMSLGQGIMSLLFLAVLLINFMMKSSGLAPSYGALSLFWGYTAIREEMHYRLSKKMKHRVFFFFCLLFSVLFIFLFARNIQ